MAQSAEWLLLIPEVCRLNPVIGKFFTLNIFTVEKTKINEKEAENGPLKRYCRG